MRRSWVIVGLLGLILIGCADPKIVPLLGNWTGSFKPESTESKGDPAALKMLEFKAFLQLYRTEDRFKMHMENPSQAVDIEGTWRRQGNQVLLSPSEFKFNNPTEEDQAGRGLSIVQPQQMRDAYGKTFVLDISADEKALTSPTMSLGNLTGRHFFGKGMSSDYAEREYERMRKQK